MCHTTEPVPRTWFRLMHRLFHPGVIMSSLTFGLCQSQNVTDLCGRPNLLLHIGTHKTGTTAIQRALRNNRRKLIKLGLAAQPPIRHELRDVLIQSSRDESACGHVTERFLEVCASKLNGIVISSEAFSGEPLSGYANASEMAERLRLCTRDFDVKIVVYLRRQDEFLESLYMQKIHEGHSFSFADFLKSIASVSFDWYALVESYAEVFGRENIIVRRYEKRFMPCRESILEDFFQIAGADPKQLNLIQEKAAPNAGYGPVAVEIARICNPNLVASERQELRHILQAAISKQPHERYSLLNAETRRQLLDRHEEGNARLAREYLDEASGQLFLPPTCEDAASDDMGPSKEALVSTLVKVLLEQTQKQRASSKFGKALIRLGGMV